MTHAGTRATVLSAAGGFFTYLVVQLRLFAEPPAGAYSGWFLDGGANVTMIATTLLIAAVVLTAWRGFTLQLPVALAGGAVLAMAGTLFAIGPGTIFPIVIAIGSVVIAAAVGAGTAAGMLLRTTGRLIRGLARHA